VNTTEDEVWRGFFLFSAGYERKAADGPELVDGLLRSHDGSDQADGLQYVGRDLATLRIVIRFDGQDPSTPVMWMEGHEDFWASMIPDTDQVMVRSHGWTALWDDGLPRPPERPSFFAMPRTSVVKAVLASPLCAAWWLEVTDIPASRPGANWSRYVALHAHGWGSDPLLIGPRAWIEEQAAKVRAEYTSVAFRWAELTENSLEEAVRDQGVD